MTVVDALIKHEFNNPNADDGGPHDHTLNSDWNNGHILNGGSFDGDVLTWQGANTSKGKFRTIVGSGSISVTVNSTQIVIAFAGAIVAPSAGGTGLDTSASNGIPTINAGTWVINNVLTTNRILIAAAANTVTTLASLTYDGTKFQATGTGPHGFGTAAVNNQQMTLGGSFSPTSAGAALGISSALTPPAGASCFGIDVFPTLNKAGSGTHTTFASVIVEAPTIGAGAATLTNACSLTISAAPVVGDRQRALWVQAGLTEFTGIVSIDGGSGTVHTGMIGIELRGGASPSLTAFRRDTSLYLAMIHDALGHEFRSTGTAYLQVGFTTGSAMLNFPANTWTGTGQTEMMRAQTTLQATVGANSFGLIFVPTFIEAASGTHGQLTGIYVLPAFTNGGATTTSVFGINVDTIATGTIAPTNAASLRLATPTGATNNYVILNDTTTGFVRFDCQGPYSFGAGGINLSIQALFQGTFTSNAADVKGLQLNTTLNAGADSGSLIGLFIASTLVERGAGTHPIETGIYVSPTITAGGANCTTAAGIYIETFAAATGTTTAAGINIKIPTGGTNNYGLYVPGSTGTGIKLDTHMRQTAPNTRTDAGNAYTVVDTDTYLIINKAAVFTLTLPAAASFTGRELWIITYQGGGANNVVSASSNVVPKAGGGAGTAILAATAGNWCLLVSDGSNWITMATNQ